MYFSIPFSFISMPIISKSTLLCLFFVVTLPSVLNKVKDMMWLLLAFLSAALLGFYDVFKKQSLKDNAVIPVLFLNTLFSSLIFLPFIVLSVWRPGILENSIFYVPVAGWEVHRYVVLKSVIVLSSWMLGYFGMKNLPITIVGPINATRPVMVLIGALVVFGERLNFYQWIGVAPADQGGIGLDRMIVQSWYNIYQLFMMGGILILLWWPKRKSTTPFHWHWCIILISIFLSAADFVYFYALSLDGAMISIVSMVRRGSVLVSFIFGAMVFREKNLKSKAVDLVLVLIGMIFLYLGSQ